MVLLPAQRTALYYYLTQEESESELESESESELVKRKYLFVAEP